MFIIPVPAWLEQDLAEWYEWVWVRMSAQKTWMGRIDGNQHQLSLVTSKKYAVLKDLGENWDTFKVWDFAP